MSLLLKILRLYTSNLFATLTNPKKAALTHLLSWQSKPAHSYLWMMFQAKIKC